MNMKMKIPTNKNKNMEKNEIANILKPSHIIKGKSSSSCLLQIKVFFNKIITIHLHRYR